MNKDYLLSVPGNRREELQRIFYKLEPFEVEAGKDFALFSRAEILHALENIGYLSMGTLRNDIVLLRKYIFWFSQNVYSISADSYFSLGYKDVDLTKSINEQIFKSPMELYERLESVRGADGYMESPVLFLTWAGMDMDEILRLQMADVPTEAAGSAWKIGNSDFVVPEKKILQDMLAYQNADFCGGFPLDNSTGKFIRNTLYFNRNVVGGDVKKEAVRVRISALNSSSEGKLATVTAVRLSGILHRLLQEDFRCGVKDNFILRQIGNENRRAIADMRRIYQFYRNACAPEN